jgi:hypothetical protein
VTVDFLAARGGRVQNGEAGTPSPELPPLGITVKIRLLDPPEVESEG